MRADSKGEGWESREIEGPTGRNTHTHTRKMAEYVKALAN